MAGREDKASGISGGERELKIVTEKTAPAADRRQDVRESKKKEERKSEEKISFREVFFRKYKELKS